MIELLDETECLRLISSGEVGRIAFSGRFGPQVLPVNYRLHEGTIGFRTALHSSIAEDLHTGISGAELHVAFEVDEIDTVLKEGWSVLIQGPARLVTSDAERSTLIEIGVEPWPGGELELFVQITPRHIWGQHVRHTPD